MIHGYYGALNNDVDTSMSTQGGAAVQPLKMSEFSYDSDLIGGSLQVRESRIVSGLLVNDASADERNQAIRVENRLPKRAPATAKRIAQSIRKRLERMEAEFLARIARW